MREESHLDDMRSAIRGDFERLAERRGGQELMSLDEEAPEHDVPQPASQPVAEPVPDPEPQPEPEPEPAPEPELLPQRPPLHEPEPEPELEPAAEEERVSWIDRLLGR